MSGKTDEPRDARRAAVARIVSAARAIAEDASVIEPLAHTTGLSSQGVELALREHLETHPSDAEIATLVDRAKLTTHVHVILSANVFTGALRAIACARAAAPTVSVRSSSREPIFAQRLIATIADPAIFSVDDEVLEDLRGGEIHVYGRAETIAKVRARAGKDVVVRAHGPGIGVAYVSESDSLEAAADAIARDVVPFDQRGCLSPRVVFIVGDFSRAEEFATRLGGALAALEEKIPRGEMSDDEIAESSQYLESMRFAGTAVAGRRYAVGVSTMLVVPPPGRNVHVAAIASADALAEIVGPIASYITAVGTGDLTIRSSFGPFVRISPLGEMQKPPFDGPVDLRD